ncbi:MAG: RsiV family protein [Treponema sp.]|jgi:hypothetical protein|nr:RsiV family protein [Treponema sp.]
MQNTKKIQKKHGLGVLALTMLLSSGCTGAPKPEAPQASLEAPGFLSHTEQRIILLYPEKEAGSPQMTLNITVSDVSGPLGDLIQELLYDGLSPQAYMEQLITLYGDEYSAMKDPPVFLDGEEGDLFSETLNWEYTETLEAQSPRSDLMILSRNREYYQGGAHGMREKRYFVIVQDAERVQGLVLEDLIQADAWSRLEALIAQALRTQANLKEDEPLSQGGFFEDEVAVPDNFFLTAEGLGFHWDPYEIAPYVMGSIEVLLPYEQIEDILKAPRPLP